MEAQRRQFNAFLAMHAHKATVTDVPIAHLQFHGETLSHDAPLLQFTQEDVIEHFQPGTLENPELEFVRWLLQQMQRYDCHTERIVGLIFNEKLVFSEILAVPIPEEDRRSLANH